MYALLVKTPKGDLGEDAECHCWDDLMPRLNVKMLPRLLDSLTDKPLHLHTNGSKENIQITCNQCWLDVRRQLIEHMQQAQPQGHAAYVEQQRGIFTTLLTTALSYLNTLHDLIPNFPTLGLVFHFWNLCRSMGSSLFGDCALLEGKSVICSRRWVLQCGSLRKAFPLVYFFLHSRALCRSALHWMSILTGSLWCKSFRGFHKTRLCLPLCNFKLGGPFSSSWSVSDPTLKHRRCSCSGDPRIAGTTYHATVSVMTCCLRRDLVCNRKADLVAKEHLASYSKTAATSLQRDLCSIQRQHHRLASIHSFLSDDTSNRVPAADPQPDLNDMAQPPSLDYFKLLYPRWAWNASLTGYQTLSPAFGSDFATYKGPLNKENWFYHYGVACELEMVHRPFLWDILPWTCSTSLLWWATLPKGRLRAWHLQFPPSVALSPLASSVVLYITLSPSASVIGIPMAPSVLPHGTVGTLPPSLPS